MSPARDSVLRRLARWVKALGSVVRHPVAVDRHRRQLEAENQHLRDLYVGWVPPGHFYSPFPDLDDYDRRVSNLLDTHRDVVGIDLHESEQLALAEAIEGLVADIAFPEQPIQRVPPATGSTTRRTHTATAQCSTACCATCAPPHRRGGFGLLVGP